MSVLIYRDKQTAAKAASMMLAAGLMESPYLNFGTTYDSSLDETFSSLCNLIENGLVSFGNARMYQLCEFVPNADQSVSIRDLLRDAFLTNACIPEEQYVVPYNTKGNWAQICSDFENDIFAHGGLDLVLIALRADGSLLFNPVGEELAPVTHVEVIGTDKVVTVGMATIMRAKKLIVFASGADVAQTVALALGGSVSNECPASYLQMHQNTTFIMDEEAASLL